MTALRCFLAAAMLLLVAAAAPAQRKVTPVQPGGAPAVSRQEKGNAKPDMERLAHFSDENGNIILVDTVTGTEYADTLQRKIPGNRYPLLHNIALGVDIWDAAMRAFGQKYGIGSLSLSVGLHNRYYPTFEAGLSKASDTPSGSNFTFTMPIVPYFKIGADYNFFYNSNPAYLLTAGLRYGISGYRSRVSGVTVDDGYWPTVAVGDFPEQTVTTGYLEVMLGLRVKIVGPFHMGWHFKYHTVIHESGARYGKPMVIPGFGKRNSPVTGAFSLFYVFSLNREASAAVE